MEKKIAGFYSDMEMQSASNNCPQNQFLSQSLMQQMT